MPTTYKLEVAPLTVLPYEKSLYSYRHNVALPVGTVVTVPFSGRTLQGIVLACADADDQETDWLKTILTASERYPLTEQQILLAQEVSKITFTPFGKVLKHFTPKKASARALVPSSSSPIKFQTKKSDLEKVQTVLDALSKQDSFFVALGSQAKDLVTLFTLIQGLQKKNARQVLVLVPDISTAVRLEHAWEPYCPAGTLAALYHTKTAGQYYSAWSQVQSGEATLIIATRSGCFAPFTKLTTIIQLDASDESYKQWDMAPRYHTNSVIPVLQKIWAAKCIEAGVLPPLALLQNNTPLLSVADETSKIVPQWINLKIERWQKNWGVFSAPLAAAIKESLVAKKQVLLYVHQGGLESFSVCTECRTVFRCPSCNSVLKLSASDHYQCKHCSFKSALFPQCPQCKGIHFKSVGYGTEKVAKEVQKMFPGSLVEIADKQHQSDHKKTARFLDRMTKKEPDILIVTASYLRFPPLSRVSLVAIIDADSLLTMPGFRGDEQFVELIAKCKTLLPTSGRLLVQTFHPESDIFQKIEKEDSLFILQNLLKERAALHYPPVYRCIALEVRPKLKNGPEKLKAATLTLKALLTKNPTLKKSVLVQAASRKERGLTKNYTLIRYQGELPPPLITFLTQHADKLLIDHDPLRIT